jgi:hypothetical protein
MTVILVGFDSLFICLLTGSQHIQPASPDNEVILLTEHLTEMPMPNIARLNSFIAFNIFKRRDF